MRQRYLAIPFSALALTWACTPGADTATDDTSGTETVARAEAASPLMQRAQALFEVVPDMPPELEANPITPVRAQLGKEFTEEELAQITTFLGSLTGDQPVVDYPVLPVHTAATPPPDPWVGLGAGTH